MFDAMCIAGIVLLQIQSIRISTQAYGCLASVETCMSDLCSCERAYIAGNCEGKNYFQNKSSNGCAAIFAQQTCSAAVNHKLYF